MKKQKPIKHRDAGAMHLMALRRSGAMGAHQKTKKALRRKEKTSLKKEWG